MQRSSRVPWAVDEILLAHLGVRKSLVRLLKKLKDDRTLKIAFSLYKGRGLLMNSNLTKRVIDEDRRRFLEFLGVSISGTLLLASGKVPGLGSKKKIPVPNTVHWLKPSSVDDLLLAEGYTYRSVVSWGDKISRKGATFGTNNDFLAFFTIRDDAGPAARLFVNHEALYPLFVSGYKAGDPRTVEQVKEEQKSVGVSAVTIRETKDGSWQLDADADINFRIDATTPIRFSSDASIEGSTTAIGTLGNCAGGITPWGTALTCEENYQDFYGEMQNSGTARRARSADSQLGWEKFFSYPPEHYGWVVEIHPISGEAKKLVSLGRFSHEGAACTVAKDGRVVVYMGDDKADECFYKFVSNAKDSLDAGTLYVADTKKGQWLPLDINQQPKLKERFKTQQDVLINARLAASIVGGTPLDRPEAAAIHPKTGHIYLTLTNNTAKGNFFGQIAKFVEKGDDAAATSFVFSTYIAGGEKSAFACPDNIKFDKAGNLWMTSDISGSSMHKEPYTAFANNGLFYIPFSGPDAGIAHQVASAPTDAEFTGPAFSDDGKTLFLSVQHPGENTTDLSKPTSHWMKNDKGIPRSTVVAIQGGVIKGVN
jgi:secreted PhoX family phosphatase